MYSIHYTSLHFMHCNDWTVVHQLSTSQCRHSTVNCKYRRGGIGVPLYFSSTVNHLIVMSMHHIPPPEIDVPGLILPSGAAFERTHWGLKFQHCNIRSSLWGQWWYQWQFRIMWMQIRMQTKSENGICINSEDKQWLRPLSGLDRPRQGRRRSVARLT